MQIMCLAGGIYMLYISLIVFGCLVAWMVREQNRETRQRMEMDDFYRAEYQRSFLTTN